MYLTYMFSNVPEFIYLNVISYFNFKSACDIWQDIS